MRKTTIYLPDDLRLAIKKAVAAQGGSEATFVRRALEQAVRRAPSPKPRLPLFRSGQPTLAEQVDQALKGFGET